MALACRDRMCYYVLSTRSALVWQLDLTGVWKMEMWHHTNLQWTHQSFSEDGNVTSQSFFLFFISVLNSQGHWSALGRNGLILGFRAWFVLNKEFFSQSVFFFLDRCFVSLFFFLDSDIFFSFVLLNIFMAQHVHSGFFILESDK